MKGKLIPMRRVEGSAAEMSDESLLAACALGDSAALGALYDRYSPRVLRFIASRTRTSDHADLDDLVQQTFEAIAKGARTFKGNSAVSTWIFGVANNTVRHYVRAESRRLRLVRAASDEAKTDARMTPDGVDGAQRRRALRLAIDELPDPLREAFALVYIDGMPGREAAAVIGCREGTLYKRLHQARAVLKERLAPGDSR